MRRIVMLHPRLVILGYSGAAMFLRGASAADLAAIISIHGRREFGLQAPDVTRRLDLTFDDVEVPKPGDAMAMQVAMGRRQWAEHNGLIEEPPTRADAKAIVDFAHKIKAIDGVLLCHCGGGMSRAPAAALICTAVWRGPGAEAECAAEVRRLRRGAVPHVGLVRFADELMGRGGALIGSIGSGA